MIKPHDEPFLTEEEASGLLRVSRRTLQRYRKQGLLIDGLHWQRLPGGDIRYCRPLLVDWVANRKDPTAHQAAIERWRRSLLSSRSK